MINNSLLTLPDCELTFTVFTTVSLVCWDVKSRLVLRYGSEGPRGSRLVRLMVLWLLNGREGRSLPQSDCGMSTKSFISKTQNENRCTTTDIILYSK